MSFARLREGETISVGILDHDHPERRALKDLRNGAVEVLEASELLVNIRHHEGRRTPACTLRQISPPRANFHSTTSGMGRASGGRPKTRSYHFAAAGRSLTATLAKTFEIPMRCISGKEGLTARPATLGPSGQRPSSCLPMQWA